MAVKNQDYSTSAIQYSLEDQIDYFRIYQEMIYQTRNLKKLVSLAPLIHPLKIHREFQYFEVELSQNKKIEQNFNKFPIERKEDDFSSRSLKSLHEFKSSALNIEYQDKLSLLLE